SGWAWSFRVKAAPPLPPSRVRVPPSPSRLWALGPTLNWSACAPPMTVVGAGVPSTLTVLAHQAGFNVRLLRRGGVGTVGGAARGGVGVWGAGPRGAWSFRVGSVSPPP